MIRAATGADAADVLALWNEVIAKTTITFTSTPKSQAQIEAILTEQPVFMAVLDGACCGFATYGSFRAGDGYARTAEHAIYLGEGARGRGLGRGLMAAVEAHAQAEGVHMLVGGISGENAGGVAFHAAMGFVECGRLPEVGHKFGRYLDLIVMQKAL
jgi:phosphinothricin acetyltransferase